jgi:hypothetical protein
MNERKRRAHFFGIGLRAVLVFGLLMLSLLPRAPPATSSPTRCGGRRFLIADAPLERVNQ